MENKIEGIIFDFNGTLFFDSDKHEKAWKKTSAEIRSYPFSDEEILKNVYGRTNRAILEYIMQKELSDELYNKYSTKKEAFYRQSCLQDTANLKLVDGAIELFEFLQRNKIRKNIATASEITNLNFFNEQFRLDQWFDFEKIVYDDDIIKGKPAPDMFLSAAVNIGVKPSKCIVFEDSASGIAAAKNAGIGKIIIIDPRAEKSKFLNHPDVDLVIPDFSKFNTTHYF
jgi:HAD superfamily hydrolase (TIGR01509 family)